ncbi:MULTISPECIES: AbrB/MazE/SpoVT family DNA-binding domain-containing protein [unclassified Candidatus Tisiphia]|jgi:AbrB family looped-hinge helix DNA binding protein|uniref:AbrB/MazE/SpoVT family DNA-binding domain-containing protein n=1 Tax=unclassified Candidatus Tisiphia TaxID=2996318 RepID=UPI00281B21D5|nr:AbrB/MazE/SpoVT family DNA-binding domain-containing protein [Rickettsia sp.]
MKAHCSTVTSKGQVTIPSYIRNKLHLSSGSKLEFIMQDDSFIVVPINKPVKNLKGILPKPKTPLSIEDMNEAIKSGYDRN